MQVSYFRQNFTTFYDILDKILPHFTTLFSPFLRVCGLKNATFSLLAKNPLKNEKILK